MASSTPSTMASSTFTTTSTTNNYPKFNPLRDVVSGTIMAATSVPQLIAYSESVGYAGYRGLSTAGPPLAVWGITTGHPYMNAGVTAITALMTKSDLKGDIYIQQYGEESYIRLVAIYTFYIGVASMILSSTPFGAIARNVPRPIRVGFKWGCSIGILLSALPNGIYHQGNTEFKQLISNVKWINQFIARIKSMLPGFNSIVSCLYGLLQPWMWSLPSSIMFIASTAFIMEGSQYLFQSKPFSSFPPGTDVILVTLLCGLYSYFTQYNGAIVGEIPVAALSAGTSVLNGYVQLPFDMLNLQQLIVSETPKLVQQFGGSYTNLILSSFMFAAVNFISIMGIANTFESEDGISWNAQRELLAQGTSCAMASMIGSAPISGSLSRSLVSRMTGTTSQLACIVSAFCWMYLLPYMNVMAPTPKAALSAVIVSAVLKGIVQPKDLLQLNGVDAIIGWSTAICTAISTPTNGFGCGILIHYTIHFVHTILKTKQKTQ